MVADLRKLVADRIRRDGAAKVARDLGVGREPVLAFALGVSTKGTDAQVERNAHCLRDDAEARQP